MECVNLSIAYCHLFPPPPLLNFVLIIVIHLYFTCAINPQYATLAISISKESLKMRIKYLSYLLLLVFYIPLNRLIFSSKYHFLQPDEISLYFSLCWSSGDRFSQPLSENVFITF